MTDHGRWPYFAGIDWGGAYHQLCVVNDRGRRQCQLRVTHDVAGLRELDAVLGHFGHRLPVAVERSEGLLVEHLQGGEKVVFPVSPRVAARARERYKVAAVKDDWFNAMLAQAGRGPAERPRVYVCGPTPFVEAVAEALVQLGHPPQAIKTERFGPTGG